MRFYIFKKIPSVCVRGFKYMKNKIVYNRNLYTSAKLMVKLIKF